MYNYTLNSDYFYTNEFTDQIEEVNWEEITPEMVENGYRHRSFRYMEGV